MSSKKILVIGAGGQIGADLMVALRAAHGEAAVVAADLKPKSAIGTVLADGPYAQLDVQNRRALGTLVSRHGINEIYLLAAMLSATGEKHPEQAWQLNMHGLLNVLEIAREKRLARVFWPSSIAVFGRNAPKVGCPQWAALSPTTVYGISKAAGENWCEWYHRRHGVDVRSLRYPGLISHQTIPGGETTDYAVDIYRQALEKVIYRCYLRADTELPMMYMPDAIAAAIQLMAVEASQLTVRTSYNLAAFSVTPAMLAAEIRKYIPAFEIHFAPDERQAIADSWPASIDDSVARADFGWQHRYSVGEMTREMLKQLKHKLMIAV